MEESRTETGDDEEYEAAKYKKSDVSFHLLEEVDHPPHKDMPPNVKLELMNARLAQTSAEYGGLLTPHFFLLSPGTSSPDSTRDTGSSSDTFPNQAMSVTSDIDSQGGKPIKSPFAFPDANLRPGVDENHTGNIGPQVTRVEILNDDPSEEYEAEWVEWPKTFIDSKGFCLGVQPGTFYKDESKPCFYVKLPHRSNYEVVVTNSNQIACDLDLYVNGQHSAALRLPAGTTRSIDGPQYSDHAFKFFRAKDAPPEEKVAEGARENGVVKAIFTPCKVESARLRSVSEPLCSGMPMTDFLDILDDPKDVIKQRSVTITTGAEDHVERSLDISRMVEGVTLFQGKKKKKNYVLAPEMETDPSKRVILQFRLIVSLDEEVDASAEGEIYDLEPPPLPSRR